MKCIDECEYNDEGWSRKLINSEIGRQMQSMRGQSERMNLVRVDESALAILKDMFLIHLS
jgi:hypothetical protein